MRYIHYNGMGFDIPFLIVRAAHYGIQINNWNFKDLRRFSYKSHIDIMMFLCNWNSYNAVSMDIACRSFRIPSPKEGKIKFDMNNEIIKGCLVTHEGEIVHEMTKNIIEGAQ